MVMIIIISNNNRSILNYNLNKCRYSLFLRDIAKAQQKSKSNETR